MLDCKGTGTHNAPVNSLDGNGPAWIRTENDLDGCGAPDLVRRRTNYHLQSTAVISQNNYRENINEMHLEINHKFVHLSYGTAFWVVKATDATLSGCATFVPRRDRITIMTWRTRVEQARAEAQLDAIS